VKRHFPDFLSAYMEYACDSYCPDDFHFWTGMSILAGALERKVWVRNGKISYYPNIYVFLVTYAGVGKSTALNRGVDLLEMIKQETNKNLLLIPEQITEPAFIDAMKNKQALQISDTKSIFHSSGYFYASEASSSALQNTHGDFVATVTGFYDCPPVFRKQTLSRGNIEFHNVCFNMVAGATFDYLKNLVNESSVMGGFASRVIYVVNKERLIRTPKWGASEDRAGDKLKQKLYEDLTQIHLLQGSFIPTPEFIEAWEAFQPESDRLLAALNSPRLESMSARRSNHVMKTAMLLSVSEGNEKKLELKHWERAVKLVDKVMADNAFILAQGAMADKNSQLGMTQALTQAIKRGGGQMNIKSLRSFALSTGSPVDQINKTIDSLLQTEWVEYDVNSGMIKLRVDPDCNL